MTPYADEDDDDDGWDVYKRLVLAELERVNERLEALLEDQVQMRESIASLKVKSGIWGAIGGALPAIVTLIIVYLEMRRVT